MSGGSAASDAAMNFLSSVIGDDAKATVSEELPLIDHIVVEAPIKADLLGGAAVKWCFPIFCHAKGSGAGPARVTRSLEDAAWLRRALLMKLPGLCVPPGPLVDYAHSEHSTLCGKAPLTQDVEQSLMETMQVFLDRCAGVELLGEEPLLLGFLYDQPEAWAARQRASDRDFGLAPAGVVVGAYWLQVTEALGMGADAFADDADRAAKRRAEELQRWVVSMERLLSSCERSTAAAADAKDVLAASSRAAVDVAEALSAGRGLDAAAKEARERRAAALKAESPRRGSHAFLRACADQRAWLATAQEALNAHELCRRESATARRHLREHIASRDERDIQLQRARSRASESNDLAAQFASWAERGHADAMLSSDDDVQRATLDDDKLRARLVAAAALVLAELDVLKRTWAKTLADALVVYAKSETFTTDSLGAVYRDVALRLEGATPLPVLDAEAVLVADDAKTDDETAPDDETAGAFEGQPAEAAALDDVEI